MTQSNYERDLERENQRLEEQVHRLSLEVGRWQTACGVTAPEQANAERERLRDQARVATRERDEARKCAEQSDSWHREAKAQYDRADAAEADLASARRVIDAEREGTRASIERAEADCAALRKVLGEVQSRECEEGDGGECGTCPPCRMSALTPVGYSGSTLLERHRKLEAVAEAARPHGRQASGAPSGVCSPDEDAALVTTLAALAEVKP